MRSGTSILIFWLPLAAAWVMMASEGPFVAAVIARLDDPTFNLAAYGVAFAFAILVEAPVIMLMSASTALVEDAESYRRLRNFTTVLTALVSGLLVFVLVPPVYSFLIHGVLGLPAEVARLTYGALWILLPWPGAIGYRRFVQGVLIRSGRTRLVALGTVVRLSSMAATALALYRGSSLPGAWVGAAALTVGVCGEAAAARLMATRTIREVLRDDTSNAAVAPPMGYRGIARFYYPLALTSMIGLTVQPLLTFFMGRAPSPIESLAVFPVVHALSFLFRSVGLSFQEVALALMGNRHQHFPELARFALWLGMASSLALALVTFTPLTVVWFEAISGLTPELTSLALLPARMLVPLPALSVLLSLQRAVLMQARTTHPVTVATFLEVLAVAVLFVIFGWGFDLVGITAAVIAFLGGRLAGVLYLSRSSLQVLRRAAVSRSVLA